MASLFTPEAHAETLIEALPYIQKFRGQTFVIKYGGAAMDDERLVERLLRDVVFLEAVGINPILVHGGGKTITARMKEAGLTARFVNGLRVTDAAAIGIVAETLDGVINPRIVETLGRFGGRARGLSGRHVFVAEKLPPQTEASGEIVDIGFVGEAVSTNTQETLEALDCEIVPVISPIGATREGVTLNINADVAAAALAISLKAAKLVFISDVPGLLRDPSDPESLIPSVSPAQVTELIAGKVIAGGMIPKMRSAAHAVLQGVGKVHMIAGQTPHGLLLEIFTNAGIGTEIAA